VRLLLDAHLSPRKLAEPLRGAGHDVLAADEEQRLVGCPDEQLLALATSEHRVLVTADVKDFPVIARVWAEADRQHAGCAILVGIDHGDFGTILRAIERTLATRPDQASWRGYTCFVPRRAD
jgi:hypothetical protein